MLNAKVFLASKKGEGFRITIMKTSVPHFELFVLVVACLLNILINAGCVTRSNDGQSSFKLEGLERAAGPQDNSPLMY